MTLQKKRNLFDYKQHNFSKSKKSHFVFKGVNLCFWPKKCQILFYLDLAKIRLEKMLSDLAEKKETCFEYKKQNFSKSRKSA